MTQARPTILIVDDDPHIRTLIRTLLAGEDYDVLDAYCGAEAFRFAGPIHALLCDIRLAGELGPDVARSLAARHPGLRVIYLSGTEDARQLLPSGSRFLPKPFQPATLLTMIRDLLTQPGDPPGSSGAA
jgi:DNA-binding response OmpR family regulator